jgi:phosphatidylglycerol---prolipoprotein diacylglyceryl transferase
VQPELDIGPLTLQTFGICFAIAFLFAGGLVARRLKEIGESPDWSYELIFCALVGGLVGARVDFLIQNWSDVSDDVLGSLFSGSGLVWLGGGIGGAIGVCAWAWWRGFLNLTLLDLCAPGLALGYAIGRVGCQLSGDGDYGKPSDLPWAMSYPDGTVPTDDKVHPTPVYETLAMGTAALVLWHLRDRFKTGVLFALYLVIAGLERILIEFIRRNDDLALGLTLPQLISVGMVIVGLVWIYRVHKGGGLARERPIGEEPRAKQREPATESA